MCRTEKLTAECSGSSSHRPGAIGSAVETVASEVSFVMSTTLRPPTAPEGDRPERGSRRATLRGPGVGTFGP
ncbi:hypothetical protein GCM10010259_59340 [Streptomyces daghestanicus]|nr:hypothetical protein GCM10010259_59340 [Streptomyces daghestanicus]